MNTQFTGTSNKDNSVVNLKLKQVILPPAPLKGGDLLVVEIKKDRKRIPVLFTVAKNGSTAVTNSWPRILPAPKSGKPIMLDAEVSGVRLVPTLTVAIP